ncbi:MAG: LysR family transcriptional regulator [Telluria sp.]
MDRLHWMTVFVAVAEEGSLAGGARRLNLSAPAVSRAVAALEQHLGARLLARTTRSLRLTEAGQRYFDDARRILADVTAADEAAAGINAAPRGRLSITAPVQFGRMHVLPVVCEYLRQYPQVDASVVLADRVANLLEEGFDAGLRIGELPDSSMRAVRVGQVRRIVCAAPAYLAEHGTPAHPSDLARHHVVAALGVTPFVEWRFRGAGGKALPVRVTPRLAVTTTDAAIDAVAGGFGLTRVLSYQASAQLDAGTLVRVLESFEPAPLPVHIVHREGLHPSAKVRAFVDLMTRRLRGSAAFVRKTKE